MPPGKKECRECGELVGPRTKVCPQCGCKFRFKAKKKVKGVKQDGFTEPESGTIAFIQVNDREALQNFIAQLIACQENSDHTGGCYSAFLHCKDHGVMRVEVMFPHRSR